MVRPNDFDQPLDVNPMLASQPPQRRWSLATLMAIRPIPQHHDRQYAEQWNQQYGDIHKDLRVRVEDFPVELPTRSPQEIEETWEWLRDWGNGHQRPNPRFSSR